MKYATSNIHGLKWENNDDLLYEQVSEYILNCAASCNIVFVKGLEKKKWLEKFLLNVAITDLTDEGFPSLEDL